MVKKYYKGLIKESLENFIENRRGKGYSLEDAVYSDGKSEYNLLDILENVKKESKFGKKQIDMIYNYACYRVKVERFNDFSPNPTGKKIDDYPKEKKDIVRVIKECENEWRRWGEWRRQTQNTYSAILENPDNKDLMKRLFTLSINYLYNIIGNKWYPIIHVRSSKNPAPRRKSDENKRRKSLGRFEKVVQQDEE